MRRSLIPALAAALLLTGAVTAQAGSTPVVAAVQFVPFVERQATPLLPTATKAPPPNVTRLSVNVPAGVTLSHIVPSALESIALVPTTTKRPLP